MLRLLRNLGGAGLGRKDQEGEDKTPSSPGQYTGLTQVISLDAARVRAPRPPAIMVATVNGRGPKPPPGQASGTTGHDDETEVSDFEDDGDEYDGEAPSPAHSGNSPQRAGGRAPQGSWSVNPTTGRASPSVAGLRTSSCTVPRSQGVYGPQDMGFSQDGGMDMEPRAPKFHTMLDPTADLASSQYHMARHPPSRFDVSAGNAMSLLQEGHRLDFELYSAEAAVKQAHASGSFTTASRPGRPYAGGSFSMQGGLAMQQGTSQHLRRRSDANSGALRPTLSSTATAAEAGALQVTARTASALGGRPPPAALLSCPGAAASIGAQLTWEPPPVSSISPGAGGGTAQGRARRASYSLGPGSSGSPSGAGGSASTPGTFTGATRGSVTTPASPAGGAAPPSADPMSLLQQLPGGDAAPSGATARSSALGPGMLVSVLQQTQPGMVAVKAGVKVVGRSGPSLLDMQSLRHASASAMVSPLAASSGQLPTAFVTGPHSSKAARAPQHPLAGYLSSVLSPAEIRQLTDDTDEAVPAQATGQPAGEQGKQEEAAVLEHTTAPKTPRQDRAADHTRQDSNTETGDPGESPSSSAPSSPGPSASGAPAPTDGTSDPRPRRRMREHSTSSVAAAGGAPPPLGGRASGAGSSAGQVPAPPQQPAPKRFIVGRVTNGVGLDYLALDRNPKYRSGAGGSGAGGSGAGGAS